MWKNTMQDLRFSEDQDGPGLSWPCDRFISRFGPNRWQLAIDVTFHYDPVPWFVDGSTRTAPCFAIFGQLNPNVFDQRLMNYGYIGVS